MGSSNWGNLLGEGEELGWGWAPGRRVGAGGTDSCSCLSVGPG